MKGSYFREIAFEICTNKRIIHKGSNFLPELTLTRIKIFDRVKSNWQISFFKLIKPISMIDQIETPGLLSKLPRSNYRSFSLRTYLLYSYKHLFVNPHSPSLNSFKLPIIHLPSLSKLKSDWTNGSKVESSSTSIYLR